MAVNPKLSAVRLGCLAWILVVAWLATASFAAKPVGVVDSKLVTFSFWTQPWADDWSSDKIVNAFESNGIKAEVVGADVLQDPSRLAAYRAIMIPGDHTYPDKGSKNGPISKAMAAFVRSGGVYFMPLGAAHHWWRNTETGEVAVTGHFPHDSLGLEWQVTGDHNTPGRSLVLTPVGENAGVPELPFKTNVPTYVRALATPDVVYVANRAEQPCLYAAVHGRGAVVHYAGGPPFDAVFRDWLVGAYSAILKSGPDLAGAREKRIVKGRYYKSMLAAARTERADATTGKPGSCQITLSEGWELAKATDKLQAGDFDPSGLEWTRVRIPNSIQHALFEAGKVPNLWYGDNYKQLQWIHQTDWYLRKRFSIPQDWAGRRIRLRFDGLDYTGAVWLDGVHLGTHEGMAGGPTFDITNAAAPGAEHEILVRLFHEPPTDIVYGCVAHPTPSVIKADAVDGMSYVWGNRYRSIGIWQPARVIATGPAYLEAPYVRTDSLGRDTAQLWAQTYVINAGDAFQGVIDARVVDLPSNRVVWQRQFRQSVPVGESTWEQEITLDHPKLWWPNGLGEQHLYRLELALAKGDSSLDSISTRFGVRTLELRRNPSSPDAPRSARSSLIPASPDESYRFLWVVNGRPFYAKGASWMTSDDALCLTREREEWLIRAAKQNGLNCFRLNGGTALFETEQFYDLCDEYGMVVWQELPLNWASGHNAPTESWREQLGQTAMRLRQHPSLGVWVGGNEFNPYGPDIVPLLGVAREVFAAYTDRPFRMSSPGGGTVHAYMLWDVYAGDMNWYHKIWDRGTNFVSEWSFPAFASMSALKRIAPPSEFDSRPVGYDAMAFLNAHPVLHDRYTQPDDVGLYVWRCASWYADYAKADLSEMIECSQMAQAHTYGYLFEHWRAQFPHTGGETVWTFNSMGPMSSWNYVDWFGQPAIAYYATKRANEPVHVMADVDFFSWGPGDTFKPKVFALNDQLKALKGARITARIYDRSLDCALTRDWTLTLPANGVKSEERELEYPIPQDTPEGYFFLELTLTESSGRRLSRQAYWLRVLKSLADPEARKKWQAQAVTEPLCTTGPWLKPQVEASQTSLSAKLVSATSRSAGKEAEIVLRVTNTGRKPAYQVRMTLTPDTYPVLWTDSYFWLAPGESREVTGLVRLDMKGLDPITNPPAGKVSDLQVEVSAWNAPHCQQHGAGDIMTAGSVSLWKQSENAQWSNSMVK